MRTTAYRYPNEILILSITILLVFGVIALTVTATVCTSLIFVIWFFVVSYSTTRSHHQSLVNASQAVTPQTIPELDDLVQVGIQRLQPGPLEVYVAPSNELNAYTFGLDTPKVVVLYSGLFRMMDREEILFILGHEMGHVALGHTFLNSIVGGLAGIPTSMQAGALLSLAFLSWNRACEYSADRAGLLACGSPAKAISALVKLAAGPGAKTQSEIELAYQEIDAEDDTWAGGLNEALATHPMLIRRINQLRKYAGTEQYRRLSGRMGRD